MSQNVCNICGANYEYHNGRWKCPACGAFKAEELSNEEVTLLYNAAQKLRLSDFDEAEKAYADIIEKFPKNPDGYWGRLLSRYGIKYEEDFDGRKIPTCYATSIESVITDKDYLKATELADQETKAYYNLQAQYIERVRKEWVEKARKEKPYDIFICYKDSDLANGIDRTQDSIAAQELYIHLTEQGYRVFFSRESLRGKVGEKYEPYIFNALSTAKVMLVYGSKSEYITSTWLKNEWTRYEKRLQAGEKKPNSLIVACDGFSPNELPKVLSSMQCFDATSRSFYTDLDAVLKKIIKGEEKLKPVAEPKPEKKKSKKLPIAIASIATVIAIFLCILLPNVLGNKPSATITDSKYGVVISADSEIFDKNTSVIVDKLTDGAQYAALVSTVNNSKSVEIKNAIIYDIECDADITKNVTIKVAYSKTSADSTVKVYYVSDDKSLIEEHSCIYDDGFVEFKTNHLSYYVIGEIVPPSNPGGNENPPVTPSLTYEEGVLQVGVSANYEPYEYLDDGQFKGIEIDILKAIATELGLEIRFENDTFEDLLGNLNAKEVDCIIGVTETAQRNELAIATKALFSEDDMEFIIYLNKDCNDLRTAINTAITKLQNNGTIANIIEDYTATEAPDSTTITFNANGGSGVMANQNILFNSDAKLSKCGFIRDGYKFLGWATTFDGAVAYNDEGICSVQTQESITLYAVWEKIVIQGVVGVNFDANGGSGEKQNLTVNQNSTFVFPECLYVREGYRFVGWCIMPGVTSQTHQPGENGSVGTTPIVTYYAAWEAISYTATFKNGNAIIKEVPFTVETSSLIEPSVPTKQCYTGAWSDYEIIADDITIYAEYTLAHSSIEKVDAKEPQCNRTGNIEYWHCSGCDNDYTTQEGTTVATNTTLSTVPCEFENGVCKWCLSDATFSFEKTSNGYLVSGIGDYQGDKLSIPATYNDEPVIGIKYNAFNGNTTIKEIVIAEGILSIQENAFSGCSNLEKVSLPTTLSSIEYEAFENCSNLREIIIPSSCSIGDSVFAGCGSLKKMSLGLDQTHTFGYHFGTSEYTDSIAVEQNDITYYIPKRLTEIIITGGNVIDNAFENCTMVISVNIEGTTTKRIGSYSFSNCSSLKTIVMNENVEYIGSAFFFCSSLEKMVLPFVGHEIKTENDTYQSPFGSIFGEVSGNVSGMIKISQWYHQSSLTHTSSSIYTVPSTLKDVTILGGHILFGAFSECNMIETLSLGDGVETINYHGLNCTNIKVLNVSENIKNVSSSFGTILENDQFVFNKYEGGLYIGNEKNPYVIYVKPENKASVTYLIHPDCRIIYHQAFVECDNLEYIEIPSKVHTIEDSAFYCLPALKFIKFDTVKFSVGWGAFCGCNELEHIFYCSTESDWNLIDVDNAYNYNGTILNCAKSFNVKKAVILSSNDGSNRTTYCPISNETYINLESYSFDFTGYHITAWATDVNGTNVVPQNYLLSEDSIVFLYAVWAPNQNTGYTVNHWVEDIEGNYSVKESEELYGTTDSKVAPLPKNYDGFVAPTTKEITILADASANVDYYYKRQTYSITYVTNGGSTINPTTHKYQCSPTLPTPIRDGYTFGGWYTEERLLNEVSSVVVTNNITLFAFWLEETKPSQLVYDGYVEGSDGITIHGYNGNETSVVIPAYIGGMPVITIADQAFCNNSSAYNNTTPIETIAIPDTVTTIGTYAFSNCAELVNIQLSSNISRINNSTFSGCTKLTSLELPSSVTYVDTWAFANCTNLKTIILSDNISYLSGWAFSECTALEKITIPSKLENIQESTFEGCTALSSITVPGTVSTIGSRAFYNCSGLKTVIIESGVSEIGQSAFYGCNSIEKMTLPFVGESLTPTWSYEATFGHIFGRTISSVISDIYGVLQLYEGGNYYYFNIPSSIREVVITDQTVLPEGAFAGCSFIETITIPSSATEIGNSAFKGCTSLKRLNSSVDGFFNIPENTTTIGSSAFEKCHSLTDLVILGTTIKLNSIGSSAFAECINLVRFNNRSNGNYYEIPSTISVLNEKVFYGCVKMENLAFHENVVTTIGDSAFSGCVNLTTINANYRAFYIPSALTTIGRSAFRNVSNLEEIYIPESVTSIGYLAFDGCSATIKCRVEQHPEGWSGDWQGEGNTVVWFCIGDTWEGTTTYSFAGGSGTEEDPYLISTAEQLAYVAASVNQGVDTFKGKHLKLTTNLHLMEKEWTPIGTEEYAFEGVFDGGGYTVFGLKVSDERLDYGGLFGKIQDSTIRNLVVKEAYVKINQSYGRAGIIVGYGYSTTQSVHISNCSAEGNVTLSQCGSVGGIAGYIYGDISSSHFNGVVSGSAYNSGATIGVHSSVNVGGIAGTATTITDCYSEGSISASGGSLYYHTSYAGGIAGTADSVSNCYSTATISSSGQEYSYAGGIVAKTMYAEATIQNCFSASEITGTSYSTSDVYCGRIVAKCNESDTIGNCYADSNKSITKNSTTHGTLQFTQTLQSENFIFNTLGWSSDIWQINEGGFPTLK